MHTTIGKIKATFAAESAPRRLTDAPMRAFTPQRALLLGSAMTGICTDESDSLPEQAEEMCAGA